MQKGRVQRAIDHARSREALISIGLLSLPLAANDLPMFGFTGVLTSTNYCLPDRQEGPVSKWSQGKHKTSTCKLKIYTDTVRLVLLVTMIELNSLPGVRGSELPVEQLLAGWKRPPQVGPVDPCLARA
jgi:hypothetical protein